MFSDCRTPFSQAAGCLLSAGGSPPVIADGRSLAFATLASWLWAEALGAWMLRSWMNSGSPRQSRSRPDGVSLPVMLGHACLAGTGLLCWISFLATSYSALAWLALALLGSAIGFGISTVTVWTPYPSRRAPAPSRRGGPHPAPGGPASTDPGAAEFGATAAGWPADDLPAEIVSDEVLAKALSSEGLTGMLVDDMLARILAEAQPPERTRRVTLLPIIPAVHGALAIATFLLATLAAIAAT